MFRILKYTDISTNKQLFVQEVNDMTLRFDYVATVWYGMVWYGISERVKIRSATLSVYTIFRSTESQYFYLVYLEQCRQLRGIYKLRIRTKSAFLFLFKTLHIYDDKVYIYPTVAQLVSILLTQVHISNRTRYYAESWVKIRVFFIRVGSVVHAGICNVGP